MASGCAGCDGDGVYAEIVQVLENKTAADMFASIVIEDKNQTAKAGDKIELNVYACPVDGAPIKLNPDQYNVTVTPAEAYSNGIITIPESVSENKLEVGVAFKLNTALTDTMNITVA